MNLYLSTIDVWAFEDEFRPSVFFRQLRTVLHDGDVIAVGAYSPSQRLCASLTALGATTADAGSVYSVPFDLNRTEHPKGRSFEFSMSDGILNALARQAERADGQDDKALFCDHIVAYRRGVPTVPLLSFHDAFNGGTLVLSGLYSESTVQLFAAGLPSVYALKQNPENYSSVG